MTAKSQMLHDGLHTPLSFLGPPHVTFVHRKQRKGLDRSSQNFLRPFSCTVQGNAAFKAGDYALAVGHYSAAALADPSEPTFFLNRAAAYLKLSK